MKWLDKLYVRNISNVEKTKWKIEHGAGLVEVYVIVLAEQPGALLEIYPSYTLMQKWNHNKDFRIVGLSRGYITTMELVRTIMEDIYRETGAFQVQTYFEENAS